MPSMFVDGFLETESTEINEKFDQYRELGKQIMIAKEDMSAATRAIQILEKNNAMPQAHIFKASPHNCVCGLRPIFCPIRAVIKGRNTYSIPALL